MIFATTATEKNNSTYPVDGSPVPTCDGARAGDSGTPSFDVGLEIRSISGSLDILRYNLRWELHGH